MESGVFLLIIGTGLSLIAIVAIVLAWRMPSELAKMRRSRQRALTMLLAAERLGGIGTWSIDLATQEVYWSKRVFEIHRRDLSKGIPTVDKAIEYYHPVDRDMVKRSVETAIAHGDDYEFTARLICDDGTEKRVVSRGMCQKTITGSVTAVYGVFIETAKVIDLAISINESLGPSEVDRSDRARRG